MSMNANDGNNSVNNSSLNAQPPSQTKDKLTEGSSSSSSGADAKQVIVNPPSIPQPAAAVNHAPVTSAATVTVTALYDNVADTDDELTFGNLKLTTSHFFSFITVYRPFK